MSRNGGARQHMRIRAHRHRAPEVCGAPACPPPALRSSGRSRSATVASPLGRDERRRAELASEISRNAEAAETSMAPPRIGTSIFARHASGGWRRAGPGAGTAFAQPGSIGDAKHGTTIRTYETGWHEPWRQRQIHQLAGDRPGGAGPAAIGTEPTSPRRSRGGSIREGRALGSTRTSGVLVPATHERRRSCDRDRDDRAHSAIGQSEPRSHPSARTNSADFPRPGIEDQGQRYQSNRSRAGVERAIHEHRERPASSTAIAGG